MSTPTAPARCDEAVLEKAIREVMDLSPARHPPHLDLNKPIYAKTAAYGHFGRKPGRDGGSPGRRPTWSADLRDLFEADVTSGHLP
jgi:S-adenosylmethionine synthetase